jgi:hypothetical protein
MELVTRHTMAAGAANRWFDAYLGDRDGKAAAIRALGESPDPDAVDAIIGNGSWTRVPQCNECKTNGAAVVQIGDEPDYESHTAWVCEDCLKKALALICPRYWAPLPAPPASPS